MRILHQFISHNLCADFLCQIILCGAQSPGQNHHIGSAKSCLYNLSQTVMVISHYRLMVQGKPQKGALLRQILCIGIDNVSQKQLCAYGYQLYDHVTSSLL